MFRVWWNSEIRFCCKFTNESARERILKIGQHLGKLWARVWCLVFLRHSVDTWQLSCSFIWTLGPLRRKYSKVKITGESSGWQGENVLVAARYINGSLTAAKCAIIIIGPMACDVMIINVVWSRAHVADRRWFITDFTRLANDITICHWRSQDFWLGGSCKFSPLTSFTLDDISHS